MRFEQEKNLHNKKDHPRGWFFGKERRIPSVGMRFVGGLSGRVLLLEVLEERLGVVGLVMVAGAHDLSVVEQDQRGGVDLEFQDVPGVGIDPEDLQGGVLVGVASVQGEGLGDHLEDLGMEGGTVVGHVDDDPCAELPQVTDGESEVHPGVVVGGAICDEPGHAQVADDHQTLRDHVAEASGGVDDVQPAVRIGLVGDDLAGEQVGGLVGLVFARRCIHGDSCVCRRWH